MTSKIGIAFGLWLVGVAFLFWIHPLYVLIFSVLMLALGGIVYFIENK